MATEQEHSSTPDARVFAERLVKWWELGKREFPWRHTQDPYCIAISELLLRKTTAKQVSRIYREFIRQYPSPQKLAEANKKELANLIKPLGMEHMRSELLIKFGKEVVEKYSGKISTARDQLLDLPGIGLYAANAILCFAYGVRAPAVDANFIRVVERVFALKSAKKRPRNDPQIWRFAEELVPESKSREFNFAVLDFAAKVCRAQRPLCGICPISGICFCFKNKTDGLAIF